MKFQVSTIFFSIILSSILLVQGVSASQWFVKPSTEVPIRVGMGTKYKIVAIVKDGTAIDVLARQDSWAKIRLASGREGWILRRFLSKEKPFTEQLAYLDIENKKLEKKIIQTDSRFQELIAINSTNAQDLSACISERDQIRATYEQLKIDTTDVVQTKEKLAASEQQLKKLKKELAILENKNNELENKSTITWFLAGGGVLLSGWAIGLVTGNRRSKRRGSLL